jgi:IS1 family transposase
LDEKWSFVGHKPKPNDDDDDDDDDASREPSSPIVPPTSGDCWDHVAFDPEHRLVLAVVFGKRSASQILTLLRQVRAQLQGRVPRLVSSDEFASYATVLKQVWPDASRPPRRDTRCTRRTRHVRQAPEPHPALNYVTARKRREAGRVVRVTKTIVFGTRASVAKALRRSTASRRINTSFLERHNATDRHRNARKARRTYRFSKDWQAHQSVGYFTLYTYNFCWPVRTLAASATRRGAQDHMRHEPRTPAMAAGLTDHVWTLREWLDHPITGLTT